MKNTLTMSGILLMLARSLSTETPMRKVSWQQYLGPVSDELLRPLPQSTWFPFLIYGEPAAGATVPPCEIGRTAQNRKTALVHNGYKPDNQGDVVLSEFWADLAALDQQLAMACQAMACHQWLQAPPAISHICWHVAIRPVLRRQMWREPPAKHVQTVLRYCREFLPGCQSTIVLFGAEHPSADIVVEPGKSPHAMAPAAKRCELVAATQNLLTIRDLFLSQY